MRLSGWVQADAVAWSEDSFDEIDPTTGDPLNQERFLIRRGRIRAEGERGSLFAAMELDGNTIDGPEARILAAQVGWRRSQVEVVAGLFRTPFGFEVTMAERDKWFLEPPAFARAFFPGNYDGGVMVRGAYGVGRFVIAATNGVPVADAQWHGRDPADSIDLVGRAGAVVELPYRARVELGVSALMGRGFSPGAPPTKESFEWVDDNQNGIIDNVTELRVVPGTPGTPSQTFERRGVGGDVQVHWCLCALGTGLAYAEVALGTNLDRGLIYADPIRASRELRHLGFQVGVVQNVTEHAQVGVRYDRYAADRDASERLGLELVGTEPVFSALSVMASARRGDARLVVQYDHERNPFGRDTSGVPTTRSADRLMFRAQAGF